MRLRRFAILFLVPLLACPPDPASGQPVPSPTTPPGPTTPASPTTPPSLATPPGPVLRLGALLPLSGPGTWFGNEIKRGMELAVAELKPPPPKSPPGPSLGAASSAPADTPGSGAAAATPSPEAAQPTAAPTTADPPADPARDDADAMPSDSGTRGGGSTGAGDATPKTAPTEPIEPVDRPRTAALALQALDVQPLDVRTAESEMSRLLAAGNTAVVTASPTPTLAAYPLASARNILLLHAGLPTDRFPAANQTLIQLRPSVGALAEVLAAHAWALGIRRLALVTGGDDFGRAVRAGAAARWRKQGGSLVREESLSLDAADLRARLRPVARSAPEAVLLGYQGAALGEAARALRGAGYAGRLLAVDDDRAALLAAGPALDGALILTDAFVPVPGTRGARFAKAYEAKHGQPPSRFAASAYEVAVLLADAAPAALRAGGLSGSRLREALVAARRYPSLYAGEIRVRSDGTVTRPLTVFRVEAGKLVFDTYVDTEGRAMSAPPGGESSPPRTGFLVR